MASSRGGGGGGGGERWEGGGRDGGGGRGRKGRRQANTIDITGSQAIKLWGGGGGRRERSPVGQSRSKHSSEGLGRLEGGGGGAGRDEFNRSIRASRAIQLGREWKRGGGRTIQPNRSKPVVIQLWGGGGGGGGRDNLN